MKHRRRGRNLGNCCWKTKRSRRAHRRTREQRRNWNKIWSKAIGHWNQVVGEIIFESNPILDYLKATKIWENHVTSQDDVVFPSASEARAVQAFARERLQKKIDMVMNRHALTEPRSRQTFCRHGAPGFNPPGAPPFPQGFNIKRPSNETSAGFRRAGIRTVRRAIANDNLCAPVELEPFDRPGSTRPPGLIRVLRNKRFLVQVFEPNSPDLVCRLTINRTAIDDEGEWIDGITWDELMEMKRQAGYGQLFAVEVFPDDQDIVDVAAMRHLWVLKEPPAFAWRV